MIVYPPNIPKKKKDKEQCSLFVPIIAICLLGVLLCKGVKDEL